MIALRHEERNMAKNPALDPARLDRAVVVNGVCEEKGAVALALKKSIAQQEQRRVSELFGEMEWDASYDYKAERARS